MHNHAPLWGDEPKVALEFVQKIGDIENSDDNYVMFELYDIAKDSKENIYIIDGSSCRVQIFDSNGKYIGTIGERGQGPGEFYYPFRIKIDKNDNIYISDIGPPYIHIFRSNWHFKERITAPVRLILNFEILNSGNIVLPFGKAVGSLDPETSNSVVCITNNDGIIQYEFGKPKE
ncbi:6-bladed beta-propeller [candidate division KSB1 bacterium]